MNQFWQDHWWLLIPLGAFTIPLAGIALGAMATWLHFRARSQALEALKIYAQQGKEPPEELLNALGGDQEPKWKRRARYYTAASSASNAASDGGADQGASMGGASSWVDPETFRANTTDAIRASTEYYTAKAAARAARWQVHEPIRRWNNAIFLSVGAAALYYTAQHYAADHVLSDRLYIGSVIVGALAAAAILAAMLATLFIRRWNNAIFLSVAAGALYYAADHYAANHVLSDRLYVGSVIVGALAAAAILAAMLATLFRPE